MAGRSSTVQCWGYNTYGGLGDGTTTNRRSPVAVVNLSGGTQCSATPGTPTVEICNNIDDDCDGLVDNGLTRLCYTGAPGTVGVGVCQTGVQTCTAGSYGACAGQVVPSVEVCDGLDNDCNGNVDESLTRSCYAGPTGTAGVGICRAGSQTCTAEIGRASCRERV